MLAICTVVLVSAVVIAADKIEMLSQSSGISPETIEQWKQQGLSWNEIATKAGVHPSVIGIESPASPPPVIDLNYQRPPGSYTAD